MLCKGFSLRRRRRQRSSTLVVFYDLYFLVLLSLPVNSFYLYGCTKSSTWPLLIFWTISISLICLFSFSFFLRLMMPSFFGLHVKSSPQQLPNAGSTLGIYSRPLMCLICHRVITTITTSGHETSCQSIGLGQCKRKKVCVCVIPQR